MATCELFWLVTPKYKEMSNSLSQVACVLELEVVKPTRGFSFTLEVSFSDKYHLVKVPTPHVGHCWLREDHVTNELLSFYLYYYNLYL